MEFENVALVRLTGESTRAALFDQDALGSIAAAGYDHPELEGPYTAVFDSIEPAPDVTPRLRLSGTVRRYSDAMPFEVDLAVAGLPGAGPAVTALWRGVITARYRPGGERVTAVSSQWTSNGSATATAGLQVSFAPPAGVSTTPRRLPVTVAVLAREDGTEVAGLLRDSAVVRDRLAELGVEAAAEPDLRRRHAVVVAWLVPETVFDDDGWPAPADTDPAQLPAARRATASAWLARSGVALVPTSLR